MLDLKLNDYQLSADKTAIYPNRGELMGLSYVIHGLSGEAGEISNKFKKVLRDDNGVLTHKNKMGLIKELGDVLWYVAEVASEIGWNLSDVAQLNLDKLQKREETGTLEGSGDNRELEK